MVLKVLTSVFFLFYFYSPTYSQTTEGYTDVPFTDTTIPYCATCEEVCSIEGMTLIGSIDECYNYGYCPCAYVDTCYTIFGSGSEFCDDYYDIITTTTEGTTQSETATEAATPVENRTHKENDRNNRSGSKLIKKKRVLRRINIKKGGHSKNLKKHKHLAKKHHHKSHRHHQKPHEHHQQ